MPRIIVYCLLGLCLSLNAVLAQAESCIRVLFYNTENFFDCKDDSLTRDEDFLPDGAYHWTIKRYLHKIHQIAKVLVLANEEGLPDLVGLVEVENEGCLRDLIRSSALKKAAYRYLSAESPDPRGIDVCLLYNRFVFKPLKSENLRVVFENTNKKTRDVLYVQGLLAKGELWHIFVCHLPSRYGGVKASEPYRRTVAKLLRHKADSLFCVEPDARILIMGDFNDEPDDLSLSRDLAAGDPRDGYQPAALYNLMWPSTHKSDYGSYKYQGRWSVIDHILVSSALLYALPSDGKSPPLRRLPDARIMFEDFLLIKDSKYLGYKPFRTYEAFRYLGGFSDHLPICLDIPF